MEDEKKEGFLRRTEGVTEVKAGSVKPRKAKLTGKTIESLRTSDEKLARRIEKYNREYERLVEIATEISEAKEEGVSTEEVMTDIETFNRQADKLAKLGVSIIAFEDLNNKISLNGVGIKAIKVPTRLTRLLNGFTKAGREKNAKYAEAEDAIATLAKSVISENEEELTVDISKLEGLSVLGPGTDPLQESPLVDTLNAELTPEIEEKAKGYALFNKIWGIEEPVVEEETAEKMPRGKLTSLFLATPAKKEEEAPSYTLSGTDIFGDKKSRAAKPSYEMGGIDLFEGETSRAKKPKIVVESDAKLVELVTAAPTLFDALKAIYEAGYDARYMARDNADRPAFMNPEQVNVACRTKYKDGHVERTYIDTTEHPALIQMVQLASTWGIFAPIDSRFTETDRDLFNQVLAGKEIEYSTDEEEAKDTRRRVRSLNNARSYVIPCYEELSGNKVVIYEEEVAALDADVDLKPAFTFVKDAETAEEPAEDEELVGDTIVIPEALRRDKKEEETVDVAAPAETAPADKKEIVIPSIFADYELKDPTDPKAKDAVPASDPTYDELWQGVVNGEEQDDDDYVIFSVMGERQAEFEREQSKMREYIGTNETAVRFLTEEIVDPITGEPEFNADDIQTACRERAIEPIDLAVEIIGKLPDKKRKEVLNRATTLGTVLSHPEGKPTGKTDGEGFGHIR